MSEGVYQRPNGPIPASPHSQAPSCPSHPWLLRGQLNSPRLFISQQGISCLDLDGLLGHLFPQPKSRGPPHPSPRDEHCCVMVGHTVLWNGIAMATVVHDGFLPLTEAVQGLPSMVGDLQSGLRTDRVRYMGASHPGEGRQRWCAGERVRSPHLVLREQDEPCYQDINDVSQT